MSTIKQTFLAKDFNNRNDLNAYIIAEVGNDIQANRVAGHIVQGTFNQLKRLHLMDTSTIFGCKIKITGDKSTKKLIEAKIK